jgi:hypothetical protein
LTGAVRSGDLSKVTWLYTEQRCELGDHAELCYAAAKSGSIALLDWLKQLGVALTTIHGNIGGLEVCEAAARHGRMHALQYLHAWGGR